jgi:hypothetical protein
LSDLENCSSHQQQSKWQVQEKDKEKKTGQSLILTSAKISNSLF